jgi:VWFA-related protein
MRTRVISTVFAIAMAAAPGLGWQDQRQATQNPAPPPAQESDDEVQIGAELVTVPFSISDKKNKLIIDVKREEVQILEDGKPQEIFSFERLTETPITIALLVDVSGSLIEGLPFERDAATRFFQKVLRPDKDLASVLTFSKEVTLEQQLTSNVEALSKGIGRARVSPQVYIPGGPPPINPRAGGTSLYDAVYLAANDVLRREAGRRVIILLTDGFDTTSSYKLDEAIERAWRSEVLIYAIAVGSPAYGGVNKGLLDKLCRDRRSRVRAPRLHGPRQGLRRDTGGPQNAVRPQLFADERRYGWVVPEDRSEARRRDPQGRTGPVAARLLRARYAEGRIGEEFGRSLGAATARIRKKSGNPRGRGPGRKERVTDVSDPFARCPPG